MEENIINAFETHESSKKIYEAFKEKYDVICDVKLLLHKCNTCKTNETENVIACCNKMLVLTKDILAVRNELFENMQITGYLKIYQVHLTWMQEL